MANDTSERKEILVRFNCGVYSNQNMVLSAFAGAKAEGCLFEWTDMTLGEPFKMELLCDGRVLASMSAEQPFDARSPMAIAHNMWAKLDKKVLREIPAVGKTLEGLAPDAKWRYSLWYSFDVNHSGSMKYVLRYYTSDNDDHRKELSGTIQIF